MAKTKLWSDTRKDLGPLHRLLIKASPPAEDGRQSTHLLAAALGMSAWGVHRWIKNDKVPASKITKIVSLANGRVTQEDFHPYVF